ncbi:uncharacterized protein LOC100115309 isoform X1 [Nasonia vitripennis]|uniref:CCHC-type domain-containing protein n=1 Tax=Nasonia vitripennis TaxID=7425 RepID=A0A7M7QYQ9_NASVI|nr:uncharacterized protein LOC100115309 isoform X1 [Nasonia vitripennis]
MINEIREMVLNELEEDNTSSASQQDEDEAKDIHNLKKENKLLKLLNIELQDKNSLLKEHLNHVKQVKNKSFSQVLTDEIPKQKRIPKIIIKNKNRDDGNDLKRNVTHYLNKEKSIQTKKVIFKNDSEVIISCMNEASAIDTEKSLTKKLSNTCTIEKEEVKKPRLKVVGFDNYEQMDIKTIEEDINTRNFKKFESKCTVVHTYVNKKTKVQSVILEVTAEIYKHIRESKNRIFVGYQNCRVYDDLNLQPYFNCGRFGHNGNKCFNEKVCLKCAGSHNSVYCNRINEMCCVNCLYGNNTYKIQYDTKHVTNDSQHCQVLINRINKYIAITDYPLTPVIQRYIGKIDIYKNTGAESTNARQKSQSMTSLSLRSSILSIPRKTDDAKKR